jgi:hypothetical protein
VRGATEGSGACRQLLIPSLHSSTPLTRRLTLPTPSRLGVENAYFPLFVSEKALTAEKDHVEGFAPEVRAPSTQTHAVALCTRTGVSPLSLPACRWRG